jgi:hypothetical protein
MPEDLFSGDINIYQEYYAQPAEAYRQYEHERPVWQMQGHAGTTELFENISPGPQSRLPAYHAGYHGADDVGNEIDNGLSPGRQVVGDDGNPDIPLVKLAEAQTQAPGYHQHDADKLEGPCDWLEKEIATAHIGDGEYHHDGERYGRQDRHDSADFQYNLTTP